MNKDLDKMSAEELSLLFPILLCSPDPEWKHRYLTMERQIRDAFSAGQIVALDHIGSTAIPGLISKPTIDILLQVAKHTPDQDIIRNLKNLR
ncbi:MAG: GrpB family protein [Bacteroidales bacterium]|nr:GrpB family protein [Bacteroidales bacterium]